MTMLTIRIKLYAVDETKEVSTWLDSHKLPYEYTYDSIESAATIEAEVTVNLTNRGILWDTVEVIEE